MQRIRKLAWATDTHFDAAGADAFNSFIAELRAQEADGLLVSGDISHGPLVFDALKKLYDGIEIPIYFIFGNHDFYDSSISEQRELVRAFSAGNPEITYLTYSDPIDLDGQWALVGHDGWADGKDGNFFQSPIRLNDFNYIRELIGLDQQVLFRTLCGLGEEAAQSMRQKLKTAFQTHAKVLAVTHVPPFRKACLYESREADDDWAPFFVSQSMGSMLMELMPRYPEREVLVLCGHCHHGADYQPLSNLRVLSGHAQYGKPEVQEPIVFATEGESYE